MADDCQSKDATQDFTEELKKSTIEFGASIVGIADLTILNDYTHEPDVPKEFPRAISIGARLPDEIINKITKGPTKEYAELYRKTNEKLNEIAKKVVVKLENKGYNTLRIPASQRVNQQRLYGKFPHKTAAILSGLGWIGKSALLITLDHGPRIRLATVFTNAPLEADVPQKESNCGSCKICVNACPAKAIEGKLWTFGAKREDIYDADKCHEYLKIQEKRVGETICGICVAVCPYGKSKKREKEKT